MRNRCLAVVVSLIAVTGVILFACETPPGARSSSPSELQQSQDPGVDAGVSDCDAGAYCGADCLEKDDACWACGSLFYDAECNCRPRASQCARPDCSGSGPANAGEACGTYWWCNRPCAAGLSCKPNPTAGSDDNYVRTCQP